jgi:hypothetical protein
MELTDFLLLCSLVSELLLGFLFFQIRNDKTQVDNMEKKSKCIEDGHNGHIYSFLERHELESKQTAWIFFCKKCLDIRLITKSLSLEQVD